MADNTNKIKVFDSRIRAKFIPDSIDENARTIEVTFGTEAPVIRQTWNGPVEEILSFDPSHVNLSRLEQAGPVLNNHARYRLDDALGVVEKAWIQGREGRAVLRFSKREDVNQVWEDIVDGIHRNVSVGYTVFEYEHTAREKEIDTYRAINWEPYEISMTPVNADYNSQVRSKDEPFSEIIIKSNIPKMSVKRTAESGTAPHDENGGAIDNDQTRTEQPAAPPVVPAPAHPVVETRTEQPATVNNMPGAAAIVQAVRKAGLPITFAEQLLSENLTIDAARSRIIDQLADNQPPAQRSHIDASTTAVGENEITMRAMETALANRAGQKVEMTEQAQQFRAMSLMRMAEHWLMLNNVQTRGLSSLEIAKHALNGGLRAYHSSSDFPIILGNTINRTLRAAYEYAPRTFQQWARRATFNDFREQTRVQLSGLVGNFDEVLEGGEYKRGTLTEAKESYRLLKYGRIIGFTWEMMINDDLSAFTRVPTAIAQKAAQKQSDLVYGILTGNPTMGDGTALFHADHGNLAGSGAAISETTLNAMEIAFGAQTGLEGDVLNLMPRFLIVGRAKKVEAQKILNGLITAATTANVNVYKDAFDLVVESRITGNQWFGVADPNMIDTVEYAFLDGEGELYTEQREGFDIDGMEVKARMVFGTKALDHRGMYKNPGN